MITLSSSIHHRTGTSSTSRRGLPTAPLRKVLLVGKSGVASSARSNPSHNAPPTWPVVDPGDKREPDGRRGIGGNNGAHGSCSSGHRRLPVSEPGQRAGTRTAGQQRQRVYGRSETSSTLHATRPVLEVDSRCVDLGEDASGYRRRVPDETSDVPLPVSRAPRAEPPC